VKVGTGVMQLKRNTLASLIWLRMTRFTHQSNLLSNDNLKPFGLTSAQFDVLNQISTYEPITQSELAKKVTVTEGGISRMLNRLEKQGFIERKQKWKIKEISLTEKGRNKLAEAFPAQLAFQTSLFDEVLSKEEQKTLLRLLSRVQKHAEKRLS